MSTCITTYDGKQCASTSDWNTCKPWDITEQDRIKCYADSLSQEALSIAGAKINLYSLLGVHEQNRLLDLTNNGTAISGGDNAQYTAGNAFTISQTEWKSKQAGVSAILSSAYIGYDFGEIKVISGRVRYGNEASVRHHVATIKIKQSNNPLARITKGRIERSENGIQWYGVAIINLPNNDTLNTISFKHSVPNRFWRLRPLAFTGNACDSWGVQAFEMHDFAETQLSNIQDKIFLENRNRDYNNEVIGLKGYYELLLAPTELLKMGMGIPSATYIIKVSFSACVAAIGRPIVIGDVIELPSETQYTPDLTPKKRFLEVTDVTWDTASYTPNWYPLLLAITAEPALASEETQDIFGDLVKNVDSSGLFTNNDTNEQYQDFETVTQTITQEALTAVPEKGSEGSNTIREFEISELDQATLDGFPHLSKLGFNRTGLYVEDAIPQNNAPFTEGPTLPLSPKDREYHRLTYQGTAKDVPTRLYRYSTIKGRWLFLETDRREQYNSNKPILSEYLAAPNRLPSEKIK